METVTIDFNGAVQLRPRRGYQLELIKDIVGLANRSRVTW